MSDSPYVRIPRRRVCGRMICLDALATKAIERDVRRFLSLATTEVVL